MKRSSLAGAWLRSPLFWILLLAAGLRLAGIGWGLPASDGWDDDGVAPRNFLVGLAQTYVPGSFFTYPPLHMILLAFAALPGVIVALIRVHAFTRTELIAQFIQVPIMTYFALVARVVSLAMSLATIVVIAKMTELVAGKRAAKFAALVCALNASFTYYGVVTNLDGPSVFWCSLSLYFWMRLISDCEPRHIKWAALTAAAAMATKDQSYAAFLLSIPVGLLLWFAIDGRPRQMSRALLVSLFVWSAVAGLALFGVDGAISNPWGFAARIAFLTGPASAGYAEYARDLSGGLRILKDIWVSVPRFYPLPVVALGALGLFLQLTLFRKESGRYVAGLLPLLAAISFTLAFNFVVLRTGNRFLLLQSLLFTVYVGIAVDYLAFSALPAVRVASRAVLVPLAAFALYQCAGIDAAFLFDPRYDAEHWLSAHSRTGDTIETYGRNAFLPRFPSDAKVDRIDALPLTRRNPQPGLTETLAPLMAIEDRRPRFIVVNTFVVRDSFGLRAKMTGLGLIVPEVNRRSGTDAGAQEFFRQLYAGRLRYRLAHASSFTNRFWQSLEGYESLTQTILVFERRNSG